MCIRDRIINVQVYFRGETGRFEPKIHMAIVQKSAEKIPKPVFSARGESFKFWLPVEEEGLDFVKMCIRDSCNHDCSSCSENCASRDPKSFLEKPHAQSSIKKVIGVVSGKGGVGKSLVTGLMSVHMSRKGYRTPILDADITLSLIHI